MAIKYNVGGLCLIIFCIGVAIYSLYSNFNNAWLIAPPNYILLAVSITAFVLGVKGFKDKRNWLARLRSWLTVVLSLLLAAALSLALLFASFFSSMGVDEHIKTVSSPNEKHTIDFYRWDAGAAGTFGIRGELSGPLWFKKRIYYQKRIEHAKVNWQSNNKVSINNHIINVNKGETFGY
ncbi:DUF5412 family protein [Halobacillus campisalis]|uniref:DUF5412 family protein n=1 Tax=Halobacillus campisalis TaxID=435909 RepID=A0ABW2K8W1_9BACI|nr:DUF5412 family protein [Halobacillus campisalis]